MTEWRDTLADFPGLVVQPKPGTPEFEQLEAELCFAIADADTREPDLIGRAILRFMVGRQYWPLGTRVEVSKRFKTTATFPKVAHG